MGKQSAPPPPDYTPIANAEMASSERQARLGEEQLQWAKDQYNSTKATADQVVAHNLSAQDQQQAFANEQQQRYINEYQPQEDQLVADADTYATPARRDLNMGAAQGAVAQDMDAQRINAQKDLEAFGINPGSTRYAALDVGSRAQEGAAEAAAGTQASLMTDATGRALRSEAINVGRGYPGQVAGTMSTANQSGAGATNAGNSTFSTGAGAMGSPGSYFGAGNQALGMWGNTLNAGFSNALSSANMNNNMYNGLYGGLGTMAGMGMKMWGPGSGGGTTNNYYAQGGAVEGEENKDNPQPRTDGKLFNDDDYVVIPAIGHDGRRLQPHEAVRNFLLTGQHHGVFKSENEARAHFACGGSVGYADGGGVKQAIPGPGPQTPPGPVPIGASPSGGQAVDDVPANLTAGEFIIPKDVTHWKGESFFQNLITKAREDKAGAGAKPTKGPPNGLPAFQHGSIRPMPQQALPTR